MTHILIPREPSTALLRPFIGCNTQELHEAWAAMVRIAEVQHARAGSQCLQQIEEGPQSVDIAINHGTEDLAMHPLSTAPAALAGPAWDKTRDSLAALLLGLARRPFLDFDVACIALDAATGPGMPLAYMRAAQAAPALEAPAAPADGATPGPWFVRKREVNGELRDCFVAAPDCQGLAYDACILCDDEYHDGVGRKLADCELIVAAVNQHRAALAAAPQAPRLGEDALHLLRRLLSNQHTLTGPEFRSELEKIVAEESARHAAAPQAPAAPSAMATQVIENLLQLARIVNTAVEDWGETKEDNTLHVIFHKEQADKLEEILDFLDSLPDAPPEEGVILSGPSRAARVLRAQATPAAPVGLPSGWVPCILTHDGQHPEEVAYGPQIMMDRLKKWLGRYFELLAQKVLDEPVHAEMLAALQAVAVDVVHVGAGENAISDAARAKVEAVLERIGAPWPSPEAAPTTPDDVLCYIRAAATLPERHGFEVCRATDAGAMAVTGDGRAVVRAEPASKRIGQILSPASDQSQDTGSVVVAEIMSNGYNGQVLWKGKVPPVGTLLYAAPQAAPAAPAVDAFTHAELLEIQRAVEEFADCNETDVDYALLLRAAQAGYLECTQFHVLNQSALDLDTVAAAQAKEGGA
ncbi:hypothetical protein GY15_04305 [Delftia sp. 670]|uniref:hypothetical protein n=1 Tax=Delftia TaxID=80865 RepID=UPI0004D3808B|nr:MULTISPECIES: hypothetical protein [Delftia]KEH14656.1 hypothetical protein GY15_04305 [Delftia sp. 670]